MYLGKAVQGKNAGFKIRLYTEVPIARLVCPEIHQEFTIFYTSYDYLFISREPVSEIKSPLDIHMLI